MITLFVVILLFSCNNLQNEEGEDGKLGKSKLSYNKFTAT